MKTRTRIASIAALSAASLLVAPAAFAVEDDPGVTQSIERGQLTAIAAVADFDAKPTSHTATTSLSSLQLGVNDLRGTGEGWTITQKLDGDLQHDGSPATIADENLTIVPTSEISMVAGKGLAGVTAGEGGTADAARSVLVAAVGAGVGEYLQKVNLSLNIPADSASGIYTGTLVTSVGVDPGSEI